MNYLSPFKVKEYDGQLVSIAQIKFDGYYCEVYKIKDCIEICMKKQNINLWPKLQKIEIIKNQIESLPNETILRCELHCLGIPATSVPTLINDADIRLLLSPFKIELYDGKIPNLNFQEEFDLLFTKHCFTVPEYYCSWNPSKILSLEEIESLKDAAKKLKTEGFVVKNNKYQYQCWKIKPNKTVDAFIINYVISESDSFSGGLKAVKIAVWDGNKCIEVASCGSGFNAEYRMKVDPKTLIGRVGEFKYQSVAAKGRLKFPTFLRWRDDEKTAEQCLISQLR